MKKRKTILLVAFLLLAIALLSLAIYHLHNQVYIGNIGFLKGNYSLTSAYCNKPSLLSSIGLNEICIQVYQLKLSSAYLTPTVIFTLYTFNSSLSAQKFLKGVAGYLNSTPWPSGITTNYSSHGAYIYTTEYIPSYSTTAYTLYYMNDSRVVSIAILNSTSKNSSYMLSKVISLMNSVKSIINGQS